MAGVFYTGDGTNWFRLVDTRALPSRPVAAFFNSITDPNDRSLYIAFLGRGIMRCSAIPVQTTVPPPPTPAPPLPGRSLIENGDFETAQLVPWEASGVAQAVDERAHSGRYSLRMGTLTDSLDRIAQEVKLPDDASKFLASYWWYVESQDAQPWADTLRVFVLWEGGRTTLDELTNSDPLFQWRQSWFDLSDYKGQRITLVFRAEENSKLPTLFYLDDIKVDVLNQKGE